jgi:hypothetical protein
LWFRLSFLLPTLGGKLPCSIGWLIGEVLGKFPGGIVRGAAQEAIEEKNLGQYQYESSPNKRNFSLFSHVPGAVGVDIGGLTIGISFWGGIGCIDGGKFLSAVDGSGTALYGGDNDLVLGLGLGDMDDSFPLIFWGIGADVGGGNATGVCKKDPGWWKPNFYVRWS